MTTKLNTFKLGLLALFFVLCNICNSQTSQSWNAKWIWQEEDGPEDSWMCFRKTISLKTIPDKVIARISADSKYWLWINGKMIVFEGQLKRDRINETYFDQIDLASYLQKGNNTIAVLVWYWGREGFSHHDSGKGGLLFDCNLGLNSDSTWKIKSHPGYEHSSTGGQPNMRLSTWNIRFNENKNNISGWEKPDYNDSQWRCAAEKGSANAMPWNTLVRRPFPQWKDSGLKEFLKVTDYKNSIVEAKLPYNSRISAYLKVEAEKGKLINIQTDQYDGWYDFGEGPANRIEYITKEGIQEFETLCYITGNTVRYTIPEGVNVLSLKFREIGYPAEFTGEFSCNNSFYNELWEKARRTLYINMYDNFMDCPDRERALWWGDVVNQSGECFYTLDTTSHALIRKSIKTLVDWQRDDNTLFSPTSTLWNAELPQQMLASIGWYGFWNYYMNTNDSEIIREAYPAIRKYLSLWKMRDDGLVQHRTGAWDWGDWGENIDIEILDNCWYYLALKAAIPMAEISGFNKDIDDYTRRMKSIETNFSKVYWQNKEQHFISKNLKIPDDRSNAMAVISGLASKEQFEGIREVLKTKKFASPYLEKYVLEALCKIGSDTLALERMKERYQEMVQSPYTTLWEVWSGLKEGTINHGWNAPNTVLSQNIAGLSPLQPGWSVYQILPQMGGLKNVSQIVPSVKGAIKVDHKLTDDYFIMQLESPNNTEAIIGIPKLYDINKIYANGKLIWKKGAFKNHKTGITLKEEDENYIKFKVQSGSWEFKAKFL